MSELHWKGVVMIALLVVLCLLIGAVLPPLVGAVICLLTLRGRRRQRALGRLDVSRLGVIAILWLLVAASGDVRAGVPASLGGVRAPVSEAAAVAVPEVVSWWALGVYAGMHIGLVIVMWRVCRVHALASAATGGGPGASGLCQSSGQECPRSSLQRWPTMANNGQPLPTFHTGVDPV